MEAKYLNKIKIDKIACFAAREALQMCIVNYYRNVAKRDKTSYAKAKHLKTEKIHYKEQYMQLN